MWYETEVVPWGGVGAVAAAGVAKYGGPHVAWAEIDPATDDLWIFFARKLGADWSGPEQIAGPIPWPFYGTPTVNINTFWDGRVLVTWLDDGGATPGMYGRFWNLSEWEDSECLFEGWGTRSVMDNFPGHLEFHAVSHTIQPACPCNLVLHSSGSPGSWTTPEQIGTNHTVGEWEWPQEVAVHVSVTNVPHVMWRHETRDNQFELIDERLIHASSEGEWIFDDGIAVGRNAHDPMVGTTMDGTPAVAWCDDSGGSFDIYIARQVPWIGIPDAGSAPPPREPAAVVRPNPVRSRATIEILTPTAGPLRVRIVDPLGRLVATIGGHPDRPGRAQLEWDTRNSAGERVPAGTYYLQIDGEARARAGRLVVIR